MNIRTLARTSILSAIALASVSVANAATCAAPDPEGDVFLKIESAPGEARMTGFEGQIMVSGASMNISSFAMPDPDGIADTVRTTNVSPIYITKSPDRSSPRLMKAAVEGAPLGTIEITFTSPSRVGGPTVESKWIIEGAEVRSYNVNPDPTTGGQTESIEIGYSSMRYQYFTKDPKGGRAGGMEEVTVRVPEGQMFPFDAGC